jgi:sensor histidine kinase regulating citrate/malate metabolism
MSSVYDALTKAEKTAETMGPVAFPWHGINTQLKISVLVLTVLFVLIVNHLMGQTLRNQLDENAVLMTTNLSDAAATYLASKDVLRLEATVTKYARLNRVAYVLIKDRQGKVIAHSLRILPSGVQEELNFDQAREGNRREVTLKGETVYETRAPILDGQLGTAYIGIWAAAVERDIYHALFKFVWPIAFGLLAGAIIAAAAARLLIRVFCRMTELRFNHQATSMAKERFRY